MPKECNVVGKKHGFTVRLSRCIWRFDAGLVRAQERTGDCAAEVTAEGDATEVRSLDVGAGFFISSRALLCCVVI